MLGDIRFSQTSFQGNLPQNKGTLAIKKLDFGTDKISFTSNSDDDSSYWWDKIDEVNKELEILEKKYEKMMNERSFIERLLPWIFESKELKEIKEKIQEKREDRDTYYRLTHKTNTETKEIDEECDEDSSDKPGNLGFRVGTESSGFGVDMGGGLALINGKLQRKL